jgi:1,4-alpha-glucan branching enzyme
MPYVRKNGAWPVGEDWLLRAMSEVYMPLLESLGRLRDEGLTSCIALTLTPILCEQLADPYIKERFIAHLKTMAEHTAGDIRDFEYFRDEKRRALAEEYYASFEKKLSDFLAINGDIIGALRSFERDGLIETLASCATHAFLPAQRSEQSIKYQVAIGVESHRRHMGVDPEGFWIPECAYRQGIEKTLEAEGVRYFIADPSAARDIPSTCPYLVGDSSVAVLLRSDRAHDNVWDERSGYPADVLYMDTTRYYHGSGLHYWKVTGADVAIEEKAVYEPGAAMARALDHCRHFMSDASSEISESAACSAGARPIVLASYDTELFGHGWKEGIYWLEVTLRSLAASESIGLTTPTLYLGENPPASATRLLSTSWGTNRDHSTWLNRDTEWMWNELGESQEKLFELLEEFKGSNDPGVGRALSQTAREVLLLESSDWPYMVAKDRARKYATQRFSAHLERFRQIAKAVESGRTEQEIASLSEIEETDRIFSELDLGVISRRDAPANEGS